MLGARLLLLLLMLLLPPFHNSAATTCPANFTNDFGHCLRFEKESLGNWCHAQKFCHAIGGKLLETYSKIVDIMPVAYNFHNRVWIGFTDFMLERGSNRTGWFSTSGVELPLNDSDWMSGNPKGTGSNMDCLILARNHNPTFKLADGMCDASHYSFVCEPSPQTVAEMQGASENFKQVAFPSGPTGQTPYKCMQDIQSIPLYQPAKCLMSCQRTVGCKIALYNHRTGQCKLLLYADSQLSADIQLNSDWTKYIRYG